MNANFFAKIKPLFGGKLTQGQVDAMLFTMRTWRLWRAGQLFKKSGGEYAGKP